MRVPTSTYRLQLRAGFGFERAAEIVPYLAALGAGDVYASPILAATRGSPHGYDGTDPSRLDDERGGDAGWQALVAAVHAHGMGLLVDIVPNHLATNDQNPWWWDVLLRGRGSPHAAAFDIDWDAPDTGGKLLVPVLGGPLDEVLDAGELTLDVADPRGTVVRYYERAFPVAPGTEALPLRELLAAQHYELADWRDAAERINYRRFFDVADLVALRQEDPDVFEATHRAILQLVDEGSVTGLRIDHVDGLADPAGYLARLRAEAPDLYIVVEKILAADEELPDDWPVAGTTGYEVLDAIGSVLVDPGGAGELEELLARVAGVETPFHEIARAAKREIIAASFRGDLRAVARTLEEPTDGDVAAIAAITAELDVYRTYGGNGRPLSETDRARVERAIERARVSDPDSVLDRVGNVLLEGSSDTVRRWQQLSGPVAAKGVEDTAIYRFPALVSRDEVGGDPGAAPLTVSALHRRLLARARAWPGALTPLSTHDTKHSEDTRARIGVLASLSARYAAVVSQLVELHDPERREVSGRLAPSRIDELVLYQNLLGAWPLAAGDEEEFAERIVAYMAKAAHEEKLRTSWTEPGRAVRSRADPLREDRDRDLPQRRATRPARAARGGRVVRGAGWTHAVAAPPRGARRARHLPGMRALEPEPRRPRQPPPRRLVAAGPPPRAHRHRRAALRRPWRSRPSASWRDGRIKLLVTARGLHLRRALPGLFGEGVYLPLGVSGDAGETRDRVRPPRRAGLGARDRAAAARRPGGGRRAARRPARLERHRHPAARRRAARVPERPHGRASGGVGRVDRARGRARDATAGACGLRGCGGRGPRRPVARRRRGTA